MQSECRKTEVLVKIELLSSPRAVLCVCFAQHSRKKADERDQLTNI